MARFDIIGKRKIWYAISSLLIIASLFFMVTRGFNMGIDFTGGTIMDLRFEKAVNINDVRAVLNEYNLSNSTIQLSGESSSSTESENVMIRTVDLEEQERKEVMAGLTDKLGAYQVLREEKVGATMGTELIMNAIYATIISWLLIIAYVSYRFEFKFGISAVLGLAHNVIIVLGAFALTQRQIDSSFVAALLTIIGYSINDTIVIFDRIRENLKLHFRKNGDIVELVNTSIYQTMTRSIYTVSTVLFATFALYLFGGDTTKDFAFALLIGFFYAGDMMLKLFQVDIASFAVAGAFVIFLMSLEMILDIEIFKNQGPIKEATLVPLVFPLLAGAGAFTTLLSLRSEYAPVNIVVALILNMVWVYVVLKLTDRIERFLGKGGIYVIRKFFGIILLAISARLFTANLTLLIEQFQKAQ